MLQIHTHTYPRSHMHMKGLPHELSSSGYKLAGLWVVGGGVPSPWAPDTCQRLEGAGRGQPHTQDTPMQPCLREPSQGGAGAPRPRPLGVKVGPGLTAGHSRAHMAQAWEASAGGGSSGVRYHPALLARLPSPRRPHLTERAGSPLLASMYKLRLPTLPPVGAIKASTGSSIGRGGALWPRGLAE